MKLLCAGEAFEDLVFFALDRIPDLGEEVKTDHFTATIGGGAVITAVHAARLGMKSGIMSALGDAAVDRLKRERVSVINLRKPKEPHAITAALSTEEDRAFVTFNGVNSKLESRLASALPTATCPPKLPRRWQHVHLCFYPHDCAQWTRIVSRLRKRGVTTSWDFGWNEPLTGDRGLIDLIDPSTSCSSTSAKPGSTRANPPSRPHCRIGANARRSPSSSKVISAPRGSRQTATYTFRLRA